MIGERRRPGIFLAVGSASTAPRRHLPLYISVRSDDLRKSVDKGVVKEFHADTSLSPIQKPRDFREPQLMVHFSGIKASDKKKPQAEKALPGPRRASTATDLPGQQHFMHPIGPQDPAYATHANRGNPGENMHIEAAKHYIQADYHGRHPGGFQQAQEHHKNYMELRKRGAAPTADHFKVAMSELHPRFTEAMKSQPGLFVST